ncbi:leucine rich repeat protein windpipe [Ptiloglossa arizonensis]|uniref:leucine rich repeat protein windpipe n=1 Tax=Ptiloglossa arizonensis TaxID=3350558 RepID=UPI003F9FAA7A
MQTAQSVLSLLLIVLSYSGWTNGLCDLQNGTLARCDELKDVKYIETYDLDTLKAPVSESVLRPGFFGNLTSLRHLDLSGGSLKRIEPGSFRKLSNLKSLSLAENHIGQLEFTTTDDLNHLHSLNLRKNNFRKLPASLAHLKALRHLDVQGNPLQCNCATLRVRDQIVDRGVKISKKILCAGPGNMKGTSLFKHDATIICKFEEDDHEMQRDEGYQETTELGSGDDFEKLEPEEAIESTEAPTESTTELEIETPYPELPHVTMTTTTESSIPAVTIPLEASSWTPNDLDYHDKTSEKDGEIFFDSEEKKDQLSTVSSANKKKKIFTDALFYPVEGSGAEEEGSGEGSGTEVIFDDWRKSDNVDKSNGNEESMSLGDRVFDTLFNVFWSSTAAPEVKKDFNLEEEQFIDASSTKEDDEKKLIVPTRVDPNEAEVPTTTETITSRSTGASSAGVELLDGGLHDKSKAGNVEADEDCTTDEMAAVSPAKQSKKGMGSYVVLAALLAILATLIVFAAYKGDFCKKKRKRGDVENGTELKDMQKALLDTSNAPQSKVASNGNVESVPLVEDDIDHEERKSPNRLEDAPKSLNSSTDRLNPPKSTRKTNESELDTNSLTTDSARLSPVDLTVNNLPNVQTSDTNEPPLSPGAQRVKITLQENPDSVPRTPILITRTTVAKPQPRRHEPDWRGE